MAAQQVEHTTGQTRTNHSKNAYPSDALTVKQLRRLEADAFDNPIGVDLSEIKLAEMLMWERGIASAAFSATLNAALNHPDPDASRQDALKFAQHLAGLYVDYGIASGKHHAGQLIRA